jgi:Zn-finger nucleic acid-binding protein
MLACPTCGRHYGDRDFVPGMRLRCACGRWLDVPDVAAQPEPRAHRCPSCGAATPLDDTVCPFCRATLLTRPCPACFAANFEDAVHCVSCGERLAPALAAIPGASHACPRCGRGASLSSFRRADVTVFVCGACSGAFVPHRDLDALVSGHVDWPIGAAPGGRLYREARVRYLRCPFCDAPMQRRGLGRPQVVVDVCGAHGVWFDTGELTGTLAERRSSLPRLTAEPAVDEEPRGHGSAPPAAADAPRGASHADRAELSAIVDRLVRTIEGLDLDRPGRP